MLLALPAEVPTPSPTATPDCSKNSDLCNWIFDSTHNSWFAQASYYLLVKPAHIVLIVMIAVLARFLIHRTINRLVRTTAQGAVPTVLRPLKEKLPTSLQDATAVFPERRRQRAEAIGSVLRSFATAAVYSIAALMVLNELAVNLAPLLASAGIVGVAIGFGAQTLVKDLIAGLFMLLEDQYGVGDVVDVGEASGTVESVGLRITTVRDGHGVVWYIRNGEIVRVGNKSQGWATVIVDMPIGFASVDQATAVLREAAAGMAQDPAWQGDLIDPPEVLGVEQVTVDGATLRTQVKTTSDAQWRVGRELRRRLSDALAGVGITEQLAGARLQIRPRIMETGTPAEPPSGTGPEQSQSDPT
jgi:small conductance mechanosensitive channel